MFSRNLKATANAACFIVKLVVTINQLSATCFVFYKLHISETITLWLYLNDDGRSEFGLYRKQIICACLTAFTKKNGGEDNKKIYKGRADYACFFVILSPCYLASFVSLKSVHLLPSVSFALNNPLHFGSFYRLALDYMIFLKMRVCNEFAYV